MPRAIVHLDADAFFASVEQASDPRLRGKAIAVGGEKRGIIASASYEARKMGIYTPMPTARARKLCPKLIILPGDFEKYERFSRWMFSYAYDFTPDVEISSIDEGYFDLTGNRKPSVEIATTIRDAIRQSLKLSVSEGIATNKLVSQIASKLHKPAAFTTVRPGQERQFLQPLSHNWLPGIGPKTGSKLSAAGLAFIGQIAATPVDFLQLLVGNMAAGLKEFANGIDERPIAPARDPAKSYSKQETFPADITDEDYAEAVLRRMADQLMSDVRAEHKSIRTVTVKVRYNDMAEDQRGESLTEPTDLETDLYSRLRPLLRQAWRRRVSLRMVSLKLSNIYEGFYSAGLPLDRAAQMADARRRLASVIDTLREAHGQNVIMRGHDFLLSPPAKPVRKHGRSHPPLKVIFNTSINTLIVQEQTSPVAAPDPRQTGNRLATAGPAVLSGNPNLKATIPATYVPLHVHSCYSFLNSTLTPESAVQLAKRHGLPAIALTDTDNLHGAVEFSLFAQKEGVRPIIGAEICASGIPMRLLVESQTGYYNLCQLLSPNRKHPRSIPNEMREIPTPYLTKALTNKPDSPFSLESDPENIEAEGLSRRRVLALEDVAAHAEGLIALSADPQIARLFRNRFYLEIHSRDGLRKASSFPHLPWVAAMPIHYDLPGDRWKFDIVQSIRTRTLLRHAHPDKQLDGDFHFFSPDEMRDCFSANPALIAHTVEIADRCHFVLPTGAKPQFPTFMPPDDSTPRAFLRKLVIEGLRQRYPDRHQQILPQVESELAIIGEVGYEEYFLVVWDILQLCKQRGIEWITRGSAADSLVCYCLKISNVCPIRFDLYFRRFLNPERMRLNKLPDIDLDFAHDRKDEVIDLIFEKYGQEHVAVVGGFSTFQARSAVGDIAKVLGVSEYQIRRFTEHFPWGGVRHLQERIAQSQECRDLPLEEEPYRTAMEMAVFLDGFPRYPKMHPCGVVLSRQPMQEITPLFLANKGYPTTHYDMDAVESLGLVKIDILAQGGLAVMRDVSHTLAGRNISIDLDGLAPWTDPKVWDLIAGGGARAVHHIESPAMVGLCRQCNVRDIDGLVAIVSVIRPGAANEQKKERFVRRYQGLEAPVYPHPCLEPYLKSTYGLVVYEEHVLQICEAFAGLSAGRADILRRALSKNKQSIIDEIHHEFMAAALNRGHPEPLATEVWELVSGFAGYAFCKAHSTAYGVEAYQSAWLKAYYPAEFMAAVLSNGKGFYHPLVYVLECHRLGIPLLPPRINQPGPHFTVVRSGEPSPEKPDTETGRSRAIRVPVTRVKGLTSHTGERIVQEHARASFASLPDFYRRVRPLAEEMEALIKVGAFDEFGKPRATQFWEFQFLSQSDCSSSEPRQGWLFPPLGMERMPEIPLHEPSRLNRLTWEDELLGFPVSGHPLELHPDIAWETYCPVSRLKDHLGETVVTCGLVIEQRLHQQANGEPMKFLTLADYTGMVETELFAATYRSYGLATVRYPVLEITASVEPYENKQGFSLRVYQAGKPRKKPS